MLVWN